MREGMGLYKAKRKDNGEWVEGFLFYNPTATHIAWYKTNGLPEVAQVDPDTVCEWTGLFDRCEERVFKGDIVECWSEGVKARGTVTQRIDGLWIIYPAWQENKMWGLRPNECGVADVEAIGNIHDKAVEE